MLAPDSLLQNRYRIVELLGEGGMGAVYRAIDQRLDTTVALKECFFSEEQFRKQFEREARLLARLRHPAMTKVIDHFTEGDGQFLVMEFIPGDDLHAMLKSRGAPFPPEQVLAWGEQLLDALAYLHGHEPQIIHRDIKPQNLKLIGASQIILLDFGLAKTLANEISSATTAVSLLAYTPNYAPLEQIQGTGTDHRSDLYALAATLYHLMTGIAPAGALARASAVLNQQPDPLLSAHDLNGQIPPPVSSALQLAMSLERDRRPASADAMRKSLRDSAPLDFETRVDAGPVSGSGATAKTFVETQPPLSQRATAIAPSPISPRTEADRPEQQPRKPRKLMWVFLVLFLPIAGAVALLFSRGPSSPPREPIADSKTENEQPIADVSNPPPEQPSSAPVSLPGSHLGGIRTVAFVPDGSAIATGGDTVWLWNAHTGEAMQFVRAIPHNVAAMVFSPDGNALAVASNTPDGKGQVSVLEAKTWKTTRELAIDNINALAFSPDNRTLAIANISSSLYLWDAIDGKLERTLEGQSIQTRTIAFSPDGKTLVGGGYGNTVKVWDVKTGALTQTLSGHENEIRAVAFSPDGKTIASASVDGAVKLWDSKTGAVLRTLGELRSAPSALAFSPDGEIIAAADDQFVSLWNPRSGTLKRRVEDDSGSVHAIAFSPDGKTLAVAADKGVRLWKVGAVK